jgi:DNA replication protein DnaC
MASTATCPQCQGTGWRVVEREGISAAERCECASVQRQAAALGRANIPPLYANAALDNFLLPQNNDIAAQSLSNVMSTVRSYAREFPGGDKPGLLLIGDPGTGKTHLAIAALRILISRGFEGLFFDYQQLLETIRSGYDVAANAVGVSREAYRSVLDAPVLLLDDIGAQRVSDWVEDTITYIVTYRCNQRKPLIATTNLRDPELSGKATPGMASELASKYYLHERIGMRARSRLFEMCRVVKMPPVEDYRLRNRR